VTRPSGAASTDRSPRTKFVTVTKLRRHQPFISSKRHPHRRLSIAASRHVRERALASTLDPAEGPSLFAITRLIESAGRKTLPPSRRLISVSTDRLRYVKYARLTRNRSCCNLFRGPACPTMLVCPPVASSAPRQLGTLAASRTSPSSGAIAGWWNEPCLGWRFGTRRRTRREQSTTLHFNQVLDTSVGGRVDVVLPYSAVDGERAVTMRELHCLKTPASIDHSNRLPLTRSPPSASDQYRSGRSLHEIAAMSGITMRQCQIGGALDLAGGAADPAVG
jgi:hypothetical protein